MQIRAAVTHARGGLFSLETIELAPPRPDEILVKVRAVGICHTDLVVRDGLVPTPRPVVLGHEGAGVVDAVGAQVTKVKPGDPVVMTFNSCGHCPNCADHDSPHCLELMPRNFAGTRADGSSALSKDGQAIHGNFFGQSSFASHAICHEINVVKVPPDAPLELLGPLACGVQTGAGAVMNALKVKAGKSFAVFGAGSVGLSAVMAAKVVGAATIVAVDPNDRRLELARSLGATHVINPHWGTPADQILAITGYGLNFALDTTGLPAVIRIAVDSLAPGGACALVGASPPDAEIVLNEGFLMGGGRKLMGSVQGEADPNLFIPHLLELHRHGLFPFDRLVRFYDFDQINEAAQDSEGGVTIKPILRFD
jgi:aryl-alcohol dehydrogenase